MKLVDSPSLGGGRGGVLWVPAKDFIRQTKQAHRRNPVAKYQELKRILSGTMGVCVCVHLSGAVGCVCLPVQLSQGLIFLQPVYCEWPTFCEESKPWWDPGCLCHTFAHIILQLQACPFSRAAKNGAGFLYPVGDETWMVSEVSSCYKCGQDGSGAGVGKE